jgi:hemolysin activation/secretion protein
MSLRYRGSEKKGGNVKFPKVASHVWLSSSSVRLALRIVSAPVLAIAVLTAGIVPSAMAQLPPLNNIPQPPPGSPIQRLAPSQLPSVSPNGINLSPLQEGEVPNVSIPVTHVEIAGASLFNDQLQPLLSGLTGPAVPLPRLNDTRQEILRYYRSRGYALTSVSLTIDQKNGFVRFTVTEGRIAAVKLDGDIGPAGSMVLRFLEHLTQYPVIDTATLERWLLLAQDVPGVSLSTVLEPSKEEPGALTLIAQVSLKHYSGQASLDNRAYYLTGPIEGLGILDFNSFTAWGDKTELSYFHSFPSSQDFAQLSSEWFIGSSGLKIKIYGGAGINYPTGSLAALRYAGATDIFGTQLSYPVIRSRRQNLNVYGSLDALESTIDTTSGGVTSQSSADEIRVLRVGEDYIASDLWLGNTRPATNQFSTRISQGLEILGGFHGTAVPPSTARQGEQHNFTAIKFETSRTQTLFVPWEGASVALMGLLTGQWTQSILPPAEQFYLGGSRFTRGYYSGQVPGDKALAATAELQLNSTIDLSSLGSRADVASQFYIFYDWGEVWQNLSTDYHARIASAGGGVRLQMTSYVELDLEALGRFNKQPPPLTSPENGIGLYWRLVGRF